MSVFENHIEPLIRKEGGYRLINVKHDRGGQTYAGISRRANPNWAGWSLIDKGERDVKVLAPLAHNRYRDSYWRPIQGDHLLNDEIAEVLFSSAVLSGPRTAIRLAQIACDIQVDGVIGPQSLAAINGAPWREFEARFALARIARFSLLVRKNNTDRKFFLGWVNRVLEEIG